jgi:hypothetical protein
LLISQLYVSAGKNQRRIPCVNIIEKSILSNTKHITMENLIIEGTPYTPRVEFRVNGKLLLEGKSCPVNVTRFYYPIINWVLGLKARRVKFDINLEYINSSSVKNILELLKELEANRDIKEIEIKWYYEEGDDDALETGQILEELSDRINFIFHEYAEAA